MATNIFAEINGSETWMYADLHGIIQDIAKAKEFAELAIEMRAQFSSSNDGLISEALGTASLIRYSRCFIGGVRTPSIKIMGNLRDWLSDDLFNAHEHFILYRDKYVAHSVDECEINQPHARYWQERQNEGFIAVGCNTTRLITLSGQDAIMMVLLTEKILEKLKDLEKLEAERLLNWVNTQDMNEIINKGRPTISGSMFVGKKRTRF